MHETEDIELKAIFSTYIHQVKPTNLSNILSLLKKVDIHKGVTSTIWKSDFNTSIHTNIMEEWKEEFTQLLIPDLNTYIDAMNPIYNEYYYNFSIPWVNCYKEGQYQEVHRHLPYDISYCFYYKMPKNSGTLIFYKEKGDSSFLKKNYNEHTPNIQEGDLLIFDSSLSHFTSPSKSKEEKITVAGNIRFNNYE